MKHIGDARPTRRRLLQWLVVLSGRVLGARVIGMASLGGSALGGAGCSPDDSAPKAIGKHATKSELHRALRTHFDYLSVDDSVIESFAADLVRNQGPWSPETSPRPFTRFLASTDFFQNGADESRPLRYVSYYDPYVSTCYNPFSIRA